jgi:tetratricopeptide (TPR) repeat protein
MNSDDRIHAQDLVRRLLGEAQEHANAGSFAEALADIRKAHALDPANVFILAFERQIEQIQEHISSGTLGPDQRQDILDSLAGIVAQATAAEAPAPTAEDTKVTREPEPAEREQVRAARQWLKNQYLQRAHSHVVKKEFDQALGEIRRVFIIDDRDRFAREFELKILQMQELQRRKPIVSEEPAPPPPPEPVVSAPVPDTPPQRKRMNLTMKIAIILVVAIVSLALLYFWKREQPRSVTVQPKEEQFTPEGTPESTPNEPVYTIPPTPLPDTTHTDSTAAGGVSR